MEPRTQFTGRYKKDLSTENLRTKVAHRKSVMQKENRHNEFKKCRGLSLTDANISALKECELPPLEETNESSILKAEETTDVGKSKEYLKQRRDLLQRFKEEKELRKLKEQREKAAKCVFKCGIYKPDVTFPPVWSSQHTSKIKPKEKQAPPGVPRVTRSISKAEPAGNKANRTQHVKTGVLNTSKISAERGITKVCGQNSALKKPETKVAPSQRGVRTAVTTTTTATTKPALRNNVVTKSQNKTTKETKTIENSKKSLVCEQPRLKEAKRLPKEKTVEVTSSKESREAPHEKKPSFAPQNFMFQVMDGLSPYKFKPMTPRRANAFLSPCFVRSPMKGERNHLPAPPKCNKTQTAGEQVLPVEQVPEPERSELGMDDNPVAQQKVEQVQVPEPESSELEMDNRLVAQQKVEQVLPVEQVQVPEPERSELGMDDNPVAQQKVEQVLVPMPEHSELEIDDHPVAQQKVEQELPVEQVLVPEPECSELEMDDHPVAQQKVEQVQVPEPESSELEMDNRLVAQQKVEQVLPVEQVQVPEPEHSELGMDDNPVAQQKVEQVQVPMPEHSELEIDDHPVAQQKVEKVQVPEPESSELEMDNRLVAQQKVEQVQVPEPESSELEMDDQPVAQQKVAHVLPVEQVQVPEPESSELEMDDQPVAQQKVEQVLPVEQVQVPEPESSELEMEDHPVAQQKVEQVLPVEQVQVPEPERFELEMDDHPVAQQKVEQVQAPEPESSEQEMEDHPVAQQKMEQVQVPEPEISELEIDDHPVAQQKVPADAPIPPSSPAPNTQKETEQEALKEPEHDVPYFRDILKSESEKLRCLCCEWDKRIELDIPEDAKDVIRTTVGQTRLLMTERFKQFEGLVDNCEFKRGEKETTLTDLEGFWDMIYYQIEDVNKKFFNLGKLEENSWQQGTAPTRKIIKKKIVPAAASKSSQGDNGRAAARSRLAAIKAALKNKGKQEEPTVEAPARPTRVDEVVFDAGFFRVASPAKVANRARCSSSWLSPTPQPITSRIQQSDNPTGEQITEVPNSPATVKSLISKSLFENTEGSVQSDEQHPLPSVVETDEAACVFPVADLAKYLVPMENSGFQLCDSPAPEEVGTVPSRALFLEEIAGISGSFVNDVFMCSPQTNSPPAQPMSPTKESDGVCGTQDLNVQNDQLDFLGSCPPINMINRASFKCGAVAMADNSIVFSPIKKQKNLQRILKHNPELLDS